MSSARRRLGASVAMAMRPGLEERALLLYRGIRHGQAVAIDLKSDGSAGVTAHPPPNERDKRRKPRRKGHDDLRPCDGIALCSFRGCRRGAAYVFDGEIAEL